MNGHAIDSFRSPPSPAVASMLALLLCLSVVPALASGMDGRAGDSGEPPHVRIQFDERNVSLPAGVSLVRVGGQLTNNGFPALSADGSQIAILYKAGHPSEPGYPTFELRSTATLALQERIELAPQAEAERSGMRDQRLLMRIEGLLDDINGRLDRGGFRSMDALFKLEHQGNALHRVEGFGKLIDYPSNASSPPKLTITSLSTGRVELEMEMPTGETAFGPEDRCSWGGDPREAWYDPALRILVLRVTISASVDSCEQPERWFLKRL